MIYFLNGECIMYNNPKKMMDYNWYNFPRSFILKQNLIIIIFLCFLKHF